MKRVRLAASGDVKPEVGVQGKGVASATVNLIATIVVFLVLAGIWACLWVPPLVGF